MGIKPEDIAIGDLITQIWAQKANKKIQDCGIVYHISRTDSEFGYVNILYSILWAKRKQQIKFEDLKHYFDRKIYSDSDPHSSYSAIYWEIIKSR